MKLIDPKTLDVHQRIRAKLAHEKEAEERRLARTNARGQGHQGKQSGSSTKAFPASNSGQLRASDSTSGADMRAVQDRTSRKEDEQMFHRFTTAFEALFGVKVGGGI
jgi:hypothetical protein